MYSARSKSVEEEMKFTDSEKERGRVEGWGEKKSPLSSRRKNGRKRERGVGWQ